VTSVLRFIVGLTFLTVSSLVYFPVALLLLPFRKVRIYLANSYGKFAGYGITRLAGVRPNVPDFAKLKQSMPAIYVANHASTLDAFLCVWLCPFGAVGVLKKEIVRVPGYGQIAWLSGHLLLDRQSKDRAVEALKGVADYVKKEQLGIWIMPEGTRSRSGRLLPFKKGFVHLAIATGLPVVPVVIHGAHRNWEADHFRFRPMQLDIEVLPPIDTSSWAEVSAGEHAQQVHDLFVTKLREDQKPLAGEA